MFLAQQQQQTYLPAEHSNILNEIKEDSTLFKLLEKWLERTPFLTWKETNDPSSPKKKDSVVFDFWSTYEKAVNKMYDRDRDEILKQTSNFSKETVPSEDTQKLLDEVESNRKYYSCLFDPKEHQEAVERGDRRLSYKALQASLLIMLYQNEPILQLPATLIQLCKRTFYVVVVVGIYLLNMI